jgi:hypothetical protein
MIENIMTNEQKLDEIYQIVKAQQSAATRAKWFRLSKWIAILLLAYYISQNPGVFFDKLTDLLMPAVMDNMESQMM